MAVQRRLELTPETCPHRKGRKDSLDVCELMDGRSCLYETFLTIRLDGETFECETLRYETEMDERALDSRPHPGDL